MERTPEEIKKGLECCARLKFPNAYCDGCPYLVKAAENLWECKSPEILTDVLAYIRQLEMLAKPNEQIRWERDVAVDAKMAADTLRKMANFKQMLAFPYDTGKIINACADLIESLAAELEQVKRERDELASKNDKFLRRG